MTDVRELLDRAAGEPPFSLPFATIKSRGHALSRRRRALSGAALALIVAVLALTAATLASRTPVPPAQRAPRVAHVTPGLLPPGRYVDPVLIPGLTFTIPDGAPWRAVLVTGSSLVLTRADATATTISLQHWSDVYEPVTEKISTPVTVPRPLHLVPWLSGHPSLTTITAAGPTELAGRLAERITVTLAPSRPLPQGPALGCSDAADCLILADTPDNPIVVAAGQATTVIAPDRDPSELVVTVTTPVTRVRSETSATQILDSLELP
jgi:hypothetical protein